jgi:hypothetical protein
MLGMAIVLYDILVMAMEGTRSRPDSPFFGGVHAVMGLGVLKCGVVGHRSINVKPNTNQQD